jgi:hypothetical protein
MSINQYITKKDAIIITLLLVAGFIFRIVGIDFGLPQLFHPDEPALVNRAYHMVVSGDLNPHFFNYPSLVIYLLYGVFSLQHFIFGSLTRTDLYLTARIVVAIMGTITILLTYLIGRKLYNNEIGIIAAAFIAFTPLAVNDSHYATVDVPLMFFVTLAFLAICYLIHTGSLRWYVLSGIFIGLSAAAKYNGALMGLVLLVAFLLRIRLYTKKSRRPIFEEFKKLLAAYCATAITFAISSPYIILDHSKSIKDIMFEINHMRAGHGVLFSETPIGYIHHLQTSLYSGLTPVLELISILGLILIVYTVFRKDSKGKNVTAGILILTWVLSYYAIIGSWEVKFPRYVIPLLPFLALSAAYFTYWISQKGSLLIQERGVKWDKKYQTWILSALTLSCLVFPVYASLNVDATFTTKDTREAALDWIDTHLPSNSVIVREAYTPEIELLKKHKVKVRSLSNKLLEDSDDIDYIITSSSTYGRYFAHPAGSAGVIAFYNSLDEKYILVKEFEPAQKMDIMPYGGPLEEIKGPLTGPIIKIYHVYGA